MFLFKQYSAKGRVSKQTQCSSGVLLQPADKKLFAKFLIKPDGWLQSQQAVLFLSSSMKTSGQVISGKEQLKERNGQSVISIRTLSGGQCPLRDSVTVHSVTSL